MARDAARISLDRTELLVPGFAIKPRRLEAHRVDIGVSRPEAPRLILDFPDELRAKTLAAKAALQPEKLDEQNCGPDFSNNAADNVVLLTQRDGKPLVFLLAHLLVVVTDQSVKHRFLCLSDGALDGDRRHALAQRNIDRGFRQLRVEAALIEFSHQRPFQFVALVEEGDTEGKAEIAENLGILRPGDHGARA